VFESALKKANLINIMDLIKGKEKGLKIIDFSPFFLS